MQASGCSSGPTWGFNGPTRADSVSWALGEQWASLEEGQTSNQYLVKKHCEKLGTEIMQCLQENVHMLMQLKLLMLDNFVQTFESLQ